MRDSSGNYSLTSLQLSSGRENVVPWLKLKTGNA